MARRRRAPGVPVRAAAALSLFLPLLLLNGCSGVKVHQRRDPDRGEARRAARETPPTDWLSAGLALEKSDPARAIACYREAALDAFPGVLSGGVSAEPGAAGPQAVHARATEYAVLAARRVARAEGLTWTEVLARAGIEVRGPVNGFAPAGWGDAVPARCYEVKGFRRSVARGGLGAPLVLSRAQPEDSTPDELHFPPTVFKAATAVLRPSTDWTNGGGPDAPAVMELHDPIAEPDMFWPEGPGAGAIPLAYDLTTPLARQFTDRKLDLIGTLGLLFPSGFDEQTGLYMIDHYEPGKIPVVFVHGLNSSPEAWTNAMNELRGDPELRKRYQFWLFFYSSGNPILTSASRLRTALTEVRKQFDPRGRDPALDRMVLIGHSMGGLMSRLAVSSSGSSVWETASRVPPDQVNLDPELKAKFVGTMIFEPTPSVTRVVFVATPHRGSPLGYQFVGRLVSSLILVPRTVTNVSKALIEANKDLAISPAFRDRRLMTGVAQLGPDNPVLPVIEKLPIDPRVAYHSIIGFDDQGTLPEGGDGVVPYKSAHLEGALSELVVSSNHSVQETAKAVFEMRRILVEHLKGYDADRTSLALGRIPPRRPTRPPGPTPVRLDLVPPPTDQTRPAPEGTLRALRIFR